MKIEKLKKKDVKAASSLLEDIFQGMKGVFPQNAISNFIFENSKEEILKGVDKSTRLYLTAKKNDEIAGVAHGYSYGGVFYLLWLGVRSDLRKLGIGSRLLKELEKRVRKRCHKIYLISAIDLGALNFYSKNGYNCEGLLRNAWWGVDYHSLGKVL